MTRPHNRLKTLRLLGAAVALSALAACGGGGGGGGGGEPTTYTVGGLAAGLNGPGLVLRNGTESLSVPATGSFTFVTRLAQGASYAVSVVGHPANQTCSATNASGTVGTANVTDIAVACVAAEPPPPPPPNTYTVGGEVTGLNGTGLVLTNNGVNDLAVTANGAFTFSTRIATGLPYAVAIATQPGNQTCTVANASGLVGSTNISNVTVHCGEPPPALHTISGTVSNLTATGLILHNNGGDPVTIAAPATPGPVSFTFPARVAGAYNVTVAVQPSGNANSLPQDCTVGSTGTGTATGDVSNVAVTCGVMGPLTLLGSDPPQGATDVPRTVQPVLNFSSPLAAATVDLGGNLKFEGPGERFLDGLNISGSLVRLIPPGKLRPLSSYEVVLPQETGDDRICGGRGECLEGHERTVSFITADADWRGIETLTGPGGSRDTGGNPVAMDRAGNAIAAWVTADDTSGISVSFFSPTTRTWRAGPRVNGIVGGGPSSHPQLAMDDAGNALLVWRQNLPLPNDAGHGVIWAARYSLVANAWSMPQVVSHQDESSAHDPVIAMRRGDGSVAVAWKRVFPGKGDAVYLRTIDGLGNTWSSLADDAARLDTPDDNVGANVSNGSIQLAMSSGLGVSGEDSVAVVWSKRDPVSTRYFVWARIVAGSGLDFRTPAIALSDGSATEEIQPRVVFDSGRNVRAVWLRHDRIGANDHYVILSKQRRFGERTWESTNVIGPVLTNTEISSPLISVGARPQSGLDGLWLSWVQQDAPGDLRYSVWTSRADGFGRQALPQPAGFSAAAGLPLMARDSAGNMLAVWRATGPTGTELRAARYDHRSTWAATSLRIDAAGGIANLRAGSLAIDPERGEALVSWLDNEESPNSASSMRVRFFD